jgi:hypothetical protein
VLLIRAVQVQIHQRLVGTADELAVQLCGPGFRRV